MSSFVMLLWCCRRAGIALIEPECDLHCRPLPSAPPLQPPCPAPALLHRAGACTPRRPRCRRQPPVLHCRPRREGVWKVLLHIGRSLRPVCAAAVAHPTACFMYHVACHHSLLLFSRRCCSSACRACCSPPRCCWRRLAMRSSTARKWSCPKAANVSPAWFLVLEPLAAGCHAHKTRCRTHEHAISAVRQHAVIPSLPSHIL